MIASWVTSVWTIVAFTLVTRTKIARRVNRVEITPVQIHVSSIHADRMHCALYQIIVLNVCASMVWCRVQRQRLAAFVRHHHRVAKITNAPTAGHVCRNRVGQFVQRTSVAWVTNVVIEEHANHCVVAMTIAVTANSVKTLFVRSDVVPIHIALVI